MHFKMTQFLIFVKQLVDLCKILCQKSNPSMLNKKALRTLAAATIQIAIVFRMLGEKLGVMISYRTKGPVLAHGPQSSINAFHGVGHMAYGVKPGS